ARLRRLATPTTRPVRPARSPSLTCPRFPRSARQASSRRHPARPEPRRDGATIQAVRRVLLLLAVALGLLGAAAPAALAHAVLLSSTPANRAVLSAAPSQVRLRFSQQVQLLRPTDLQVLSSSGTSVAAGSGERDPANSHDLVIPVQRSLADGTYTVRWLVVSADSHVVTGFTTFAVGPGPVGAPYLGAAFGGRGGPSETSARGGSARVFELVRLSGPLAPLALPRPVSGPALQR